MSLRLRIQNTRPVLPRFVFVTHYYVLSLSLLRAYLQNYTSDLRQLCCTCYPWPWLGPALAALRYVMYIRPILPRFFFTYHYTSCLSLLRAYLLNCTSDLRQLFSACYLWPWLGPPLAALRYVMYIRPIVPRFVFTYHYTPCLSVRERIPDPNLRSSPTFCACGSVLSRWRCNMRCISSFMDDVMFAHTGPYEGMSADTAAASDVTALSHAG